MRNENSPFIRIHDNYAGAFWGTLHFTAPQVFDGVCADGFSVLLLACFDGVCIQ
jgi:hypothetical protein